MRVYADPPAQPKDGHRDGGRAQEWRQSPKDGTALPIRRTPRNSIVTMR